MWILGIQTQILQLAQQIFSLHTKPSPQPTSHLLTGISLMTAIKLVCQTCPVCVVNSPKPGMPSLINPIQKQNICSGKDWPGLKGIPSSSRYLYGVDRRFHYPLRWLMDSSEQLFPDSASQGHSKDGHDHPLLLRSPKGSHSNTHIPADLSFLERADQTFNYSLASLCQETLENGLTLLLIPLMEIRNTPYIQDDPYEMLQLSWLTCARRP